MAAVKRWLRPTISVLMIGVSILPLIWETLLFMNSPSGMNYGMEMALFALFLSPIFMSGIFLWRRDKHAWLPISLLTLYSGITTLMALKRYVSLVLGPHPSGGTAGQIALFLRYSLFDLLGDAIVLLPLLACTIYCYIACNGKQRAVQSGTPPAK